MHAQHFKKSINNGTSNFSLEETIRFGRKVSTTFFLTIVNYENSTVLVIFIFLLEYNSCFFSISRYIHHTWFIHGVVQNIDEQWIYDIWSMAWRSMGNRWIIARDSRSIDLGCYDETVKKSNWEVARWGMGRNRIKMSVFNVESQLWSEF